MRFGLSTNGMNPFGKWGSSHSTWPVTICMFNLLSWLCMKRKYIMMPVLIQRPKQSDNDIDVYLSRWLMNFTVVEERRCTCVG
jgi:hypothetical protein